MKRVFPIIQKLMPGRKLAPALAIPSMGLVCIVVSQAWETSGLQDGVVIVALATLCVAILVDTLAVREESRQLGAAPQDLQRLAETIERGNMDMDISTDQTATGAYAAMQSILRNLRHSSADGRIARVASDRIKQALNVIDRIVLVSDESCNIAYINQVGIRFFQEAAPNIRKDLPGFNANQLYGKCIGLFYMNPIQRRRVVDKLSSEYKTEINFGGRIFTVIANPLFAEDGQRQGVAMEWIDRTEEVAVEEEVQQLVDNAYAGDLGQRITVDTSNGLSKAISGGLNKLIGLADQVITDTVLSLGGLIASSDEIVRGNSYIKRWAKKQAASLEKADSAMSELEIIVTRNFSQAEDAARLGELVQRQAEKAAAVVGRACATIGEINKSNREAANVIDTVSKIASQIDALALNTSLKVAHSGDDDNVFTSIAAEMRSLAERSAASAKDVKSLLGNRIDKIDGGIRLISESGESLTTISDDVVRVTNTIRDIAIENKKEVANLGGVCRAILRKNKYLHKNATPVLLAESAATTLVVNLKGLEQLVRFFTKNGNAGMSVASSRSLNLELTSAPGQHLGSETVWKKKTPHLTLLKFPNSVLQ